MTADMTITGDCIVLLGVYSYIYSVNPSIESYRDMT